MYASKKKGLWLTRTIHRNEMLLLQVPWRQRSSKLLVRYYWNSDYFFSTLTLMKNISQTKVKIEKPSKPTGPPLPEGAEPNFSGIAIPTWLQKYAVRKNPWKSPDAESCNKLGKICKLLFGDDFKIDLSDTSDAWKKVRCHCFHCIWLTCL